MSDSTAIDITAEPPTGRSSKWRVLIGGKPEKLDPDDGTSRRRVAKRYGITEDALLEAVQRASDEAAQARAAEAEANSPRRDAPVHAWSADNSVHRDYPGLGDALRDRASGCDYVKLGDTHRIACVDVDLTDDAKAAGRGFTEADVARLLSLPTATPRYAWLSKSGGLHAVFYPCARYLLSGPQRAGLFVLEAHNVTQSGRVAAVEDVKVTATVPKGRDLHVAQRDYGVADMRGALLRRGGREAASEEQVAAWLAGRGMELGRRYGGEYCPFDHLQGRRDPVEVTEDGVRCFGCHRFAPWSRLAGDEATNAPLPIAVDMAAQRVHWTHARYVLEAEYPAVVATGGCFLRAGYEALVTILNTEDA
jgi:hypothetical protein